MDLHTGVDDPSELLALLSDSLSWEGRGLFEWRYEEFPGYDPDEHAFAVTEDGELVAFRRVFRRELEIDDGLVPVHLYGDTVVRPDYRGRGLYTDLLEHTDRYADRADVSVAMTFNREGTITYGAKRDRGWSACSLPLQLRVLSPSTVLEEYATHVLEPEAIPRPLGRLGSRLHVDTCDGRFDLASVLRSDSEETPDRTVGVGLTNAAVSDFVEAAASDGRTVPAFLRTGIDVLRRRDVTIGSGPGCPVPGSSRIDSDDSCTVERTATLDQDAVDSVIDQLDREPPAFRRDRRDIDHLFSYPGADVFLARRDGQVVGVTVLGPRENGAVTEGWLLELAGTDDDVVSSLAEHAVRRANARGFDLVVASTPADLGSRWASVDRQLLMWRPVSPRTDLSVAETRVSMYDVF